MNIFWKLIGTTKPHATDANVATRNAARVAFQRLWVAGTLGAFFFAFARNFPDHVVSLLTQQDPTHALTIILKYVYLLWLLTYFFISNVNNENAGSPTTRDLVYDVMQSTLALASAFIMGFIRPEYSYNIESFIFSNFTIFVICLLAIFLFNKNQKQGINAIRAWGGLLAVISIIAIWAYCQYSLSEYALFAVLFIIAACLWWLLMAFIRIRILSGEKD